MAESQERPERAASTETGRHSHRRKARKRRAGESPGALSDGTLEQRVTRWLAILVGVIILVGQLVMTHMLLPGQVLRATIVVLGIAALAMIMVWLDQQRSKKRNPKPRWMRGIIIAGFLCFSVVVGALIVLNMSANPIEEGSFEAAESSSGAFSSRMHFDAKTMQLKVALFHIMATIGGMALLAHAAGPAKHRRNEARVSSMPSTPPATP